MDQPQPDSAAVCFWLKWCPEFVQKDLVFWSMNDFSYTVCRRLSEVFQCPPVGFLSDAGYSSHEYSANPPLWPVIPKTWETILQMKTISKYVTFKINQQKKCVGLHTLSFWREHIRKLQSGLSNDLNKRESISPDLLGPEKMSSIGWGFIGHNKSR